MEISKSAVPEGDRSFLSFPFPGPSSPSAPGGGPGGNASRDGLSSEPLALLSFAAWGDMKFGSPASGANRSGFLRALGIDPASAMGLNLVHSRNVVFPRRGDDAAALAEAAGGADGIILDDPGLAATVTVADCMPIWILDRGTGAFGVLHSGWMGTGILLRAVRELERRGGTRPGDLSVILGPAIGSCCYEVQPDRAEAYAAEFGPSSVLRRGDSWRLDLRAANIALAKKAGVGYLLSIEACTSCDPRLGSYRRQGSAAFIRMLAVCGRADPVRLASPETASP